MNYEAAVIVAIALLGGAFMISMALAPIASALDKIAKRLARGTEEGAE